MNTTSNIDRNLYPILTNPSQEATELKSFVQLRLQQVNQEIERAKAELEDRIRTTSQLKPTDEETKLKLNQVIDNMLSIKSKLDTLNSNYEGIAIAMMSFFESIVSTRTRIVNYFEQNQDSESSSSVGHEKFREATMEQFRSLISQSETIIKMVREVEPEGVKEEDTDRIITLLEQLRVMFESKAASKQTEIQEYHTVNQFKVDTRELNGSLDEMNRQLMEIGLNHSNSGDNYEIALERSKIFENFEKNLEVIKNKMDQHELGSRNIYERYPKWKDFIEAEVNNSKSRLQESVASARKYRAKIDSGLSYAKMVNEVSWEIIIFIE